MKNIRYCLILLFAFLFGMSCKQGVLDPITKVAPGPDELAPTITINYPLEGTLIRIEGDVTSVNIDFVAADDIELQSVSVNMDGTELVKYSDFKDYRQVMEKYQYDNLTNGNHILSIVATDLSGKSTTKTVNFQKTAPYKAKYDGEVFYMPFDGDYFEQLSYTPATIIGVPGFADGKVGKAYAGATNASLTFPTTNLIKTQEISAVFWMKVNAVPDRAGILIASPEDKANAKYPTVQNLRTSGFRFFREASGKMQLFKANVGLGATAKNVESWNDGGTIDPTTSGWTHFAFTVSGTKSTIYINGKMVREATLTPIDWTGCDVLTIMSGVPRFTEWLHFSDLSLLDELRIFNKALTADEVTTIYNAEK